MADNDNNNFNEGDYVVYPAHGVGMIEGIETQTIGGWKSAFMPSVLNKTACV